MDEERIAKQLDFDAILARRSGLFEMANYSAEIAYCIRAGYPILIGLVHGLACMALQERLGIILRGKSREN